MCNLKRIVLVLTVICFYSSDFKAQNVSPALRNNVSFEIPNRLKKIKQEGQKVTFRDSKTNAKLSFEKINTTALESLTLTQVEIDYMNCATSSQNVDIKTSTSEYLLGMAQILDWNTLSKNGNKVADGSRVVLMDINGTLYRFTIEFDVDERKAAYHLLNNFLDKSVPLYNISSFSH